MAAESTRRLRGHSGEYTLTRSSARRLWGPAVAAQYPVWIVETEALDRILTEHPEMEFA